jgi:peptide methionine sulfoxide reductase msrA/msrB
LEIHDPTQINGQGPDIGKQYLSAIFCYDEKQKQIAKTLITQLEQQAYLVATKIKDMAIFWPAEDYHQDYYNQKHSLPYCHNYVKRFK